MLKLSKTGIKELSKRYRLVLMASLFLCGFTVLEANATDFNPSATVEENYTAFKTAIGGGETFKIGRYTIDQNFAKEHPATTREILGTILTTSSNSTTAGEPNYSAIATAVYDFTELTGAVVSRDILGIDASNPDFATVYGSTNHLQQSTTLADADIKLDTAIKNNTDAIAQNTSAIQTNADAIAQNTSAIQTNAGVIAQNTSAIQTNADAIAQNTSAIQTNADAIAQNTSAIQTNAGVIAQNTSAIQTNADAIAQNTSAIQTNAGVIAQNTSAIQTNADAIAQNTSAIQANTVALGDIAGLAETNRYARYTNVADNLSALDSALSDVDSRVRRLDKQMKGGFASMAALSALQPNARASSDTQLSMGTGTYRGRVGMALGAFHYINDNTMLNLGASYAGSTSATFRAGVTLGW